MDMDMDMAMDMDMDMDMDMPVHMCMCMSPRPPTGKLALFSLIELILMILSIAMPVPNGCFMPLFILGAATGRLYGERWG